VPVKKNKLDATEEEDPQDAGIVTPPRSRSRSSSGQGALSAADLGKSPPMETKVRHISRRVEDITWKDRTPQVTEVQVEVQANPEISTPAVLEAAAEIAQVPGYVQPETHDVDISDESQKTSTDEPSVSAIASDSNGVEDHKMERRRSDDSVSGGTKRQREDGEQDANPRETKRPSPPPEEKLVAPVPTPASGTAPKTVCMGSQTAGKLLTTRV
jgi:Ran-binding protein 3